MLNKTKKKRTAKKGKAEQVSSIASKGDCSNDSRNKLKNLIICDTVM